MKVTSRPKHKQTLKMAEEPKAVKKKEKSRFFSKSKEQKQDIYDGRKAPSTNKATKVWMKCFNDYLKEKNLPDSETISSDDLPAVLSDFYTELRKSDSEGEYKTSTLKCIRAAINRYYKSKRSLDILSDPRFIMSNEMFTGVTRKAKKEGRGEVDSRPPIEEEDMKRISSYFAQYLNGPPNAVKLIEMALFSIIYYMGRRGRQNLRKMTKETFKVATDSSGKKYIYQAVKELDKNHKQDDLSPNNQGRIYEQPGVYFNHINTTKYHSQTFDKVLWNLITCNSKKRHFVSDSPICPVMIFELYLSKLHPSRNDLWQRPKKEINDVYKEWFDNVPLGKDPLNAAMKTISVNAGLSKVYTNHCIRSTVMETLDEGEFESRHIMAQTGHKSESSIKVYARRCPTKKKEEMSYCLANKLNQPENQIDIEEQVKAPPAKKQKSNTVTKPTPNLEEKNAPEVPILPENFEVVMEDPEEIPDDQLLKAIEQIEKENAQITAENQVVPVPNAAMVPLQPLAPGNSINVNNNVANYAMANNNPLPTFYFPNSANITINYNFNK